MSWLEYTDTKNKQEEKEVDKAAENVQALINNSRQRINAANALSSWNHTWIHKK
jgi:hypothetical protein